jgi:hypothetical protein
VGNSNKNMHGANSTVDSISDKNVWLIGLIHFPFHNASYFTGTVQPTDDRRTIAAYALGLTVRALFHMHAALPVVSRI